MNSVTIRGRTLRLPIIQGGMGIGVSLGGLAGSVAACGGMGVISTANIGFRSPNFWQEPLKENLRELTAQIEKAKAIAGNALGMVAINLMVATTHYAETAKAAIAAGIDAIISGAGLPLELPALASGSDTALAPIVSSGKAAHIICTMWERRHNRLPDFIVVEGSKAGGHLGFKTEELLNETAQPLDQILTDVLQAVAPFERKHDIKIPVFVAGGVKNGAEVAAYAKLGASGAQIATRFIATEECEAGELFKERVLHARNSDVAIIKSPVGMPGRALRTPLIEKLAAGERIPIEKCIHCLHTCDVKTTPYCISRALIHAVCGDLENGLFFCGSEAEHVGEILPVKTVMAALEQEWREAE